MGLLIRYLDTLRCGTSISPCEYRLTHDLIFALLAFCFSSAIWRVILYPKVFSPLKHFPEPSGGTIFNGQLWRILREPTGYPMREWINNQPNGGIIRFTTICNQERLLLTSPEALKEVMISKCYDWEKPNQLRIGLGRIVGHGILLASGDEHKRQRKLLLPAFSPRVIDDLVVVFWSKACHMVRLLCRTIELEPVTTSETESNSAVVEMSDWLRRVTLDIIGVAGMGYDFNSLEEPRSELNIAYHKVFKQAHNERSMLFIETMENLVPVAWLGRLPIEHNRVVHEGAKTVRKLAAALIAERRKYPTQKDDSFVQRDILGLAVASGEFTDEALIDQVMTFLAAGHETVSSAMSWALVSLCQKPHIQERLRAEVRNSLPLKSNNFDLGLSAVNRLPYLQAVCNEVLRYHTPIPLSRRVSVKETSILGHRIPKDTNILIVPAAVNFSKALWGDDALDFNPERWIQQDCTNSGGSTSPFGNMSFMHGPRSCIGMSFAKAEFACLLAAVVGRFKMEFPTLDQDIEILRGGVARKLKQDLKIRITDLGGW